MGKTAVVTTKVLRHPSGLSAEEMRKLREKLEIKDAELSKEISELELDLTREDSEGKAPDEVDRSSFEEEMQRSQLVLDGKNRLLYEVQTALRRMNEGSYGICEETEEPIGFKRLWAQPWTRLSLEAQQEMEARSKNNPHARYAGFGSVSSGSNYEGGAAETGDEA